MNTYELMVIYGSSIKESDVKDHISSIKDKIKELGGKTTKEDYWGLKRLAYEMKKNTSAYYIVLNLELPGEQIDALKAWFNREDEKVLRILLTKV